MKRVFIPFDLPSFEYINSNHPLPASLIEPRYDGIEFVRAGPPSDLPVGGAGVFRQAGELAAQLEPHRSRMVGFDARVFEFMLSRDLGSQARTDTTADLAYFHTAPMHFNQMPWFMHLENVTPLFHPMLAQGDSQQIGLRDIPGYWFVRTMLESPRCRGLFTNLALTKAQVERIFDSEAIARKTHHVRAGPYFTPAEDAKISAAVEAKRTKEEVDILFTNSWHQRWPNFFLRGGPELVVGFLSMVEQFPNARLTLRTVWPDILQGSEIEKRVRSHPRITLVEHKLSDEEMLELYMRADVFALDAASLHSVSVLRAMYCGATCIVSDAPGYEEYLTDGESGIVMPGRRAAVYSEDPVSGWIRDDFKPMYSMDNTRVKLMADLLSALCGNATMRRTLGMNARRSVMERNSFAGWQRGFETLLRSALDTPRERT